MSSPNYALSSPNTNITESANVVRNIGEPIDLQAVRFRNIQNIQQKIPSKAQLIEASIRLRDMARYLSSNLPINISVYLIDGNSSGKRNYQNKLYKITDIKKSDGNWNTLTVGHALRLITEEIAVIENQQYQPVIDLLAKDAKDDYIYHPLIRMPLKDVCYAILEQL